VKDHSARLDETEAAYLEIPNPTAAKIHAYFAEGTPKKGCGCGLGEACKHGPPRLPGPDGAPYALRTVQDWLKAVKGRLRARAGRRREDNRARNAAVFDRLRVQAERQGDLREAINATARLAELDGSHLAAEEAQRPRLYDRVRDLMLAVEDYEPPAAPAEPLAPVPREVARHQLARLERLLLKVDEGAARYRALGEPPADEAQRLTWRRNVLDEAIVQTVTSPAVAPEKKRDLIVKAAGTAAMITEGADLAERVTRLEKAARGGSP
jgi:hypothetical protein